MGDAFLHGFEFEGREVDEIRALFGNDFANSVANHPVGTWQGPAASSYGLHLVRIEVRGEARPVAFEEVREAVRRDFEEERRLIANREMFERLRDRYGVFVDEGALREATAIRTARR
jgi:parvulin-like peptidyl-prolyl isomerase